MDEGPHGPQPGLLPIGSNGETGVSTVRGMVLGNETVGSSVQGMVRGQLRDYGTRRKRGVILGYDDIQGGHKEWYLGNMGYHHS